VNRIAPVLSPRAARVFYAAADAWCCADGDADPLARRDLAASAAVHALSPSERRRIARWLALVEWSPRLALRSGRGFAWLDRQERRAWLEHLSAARNRSLARAIRDLRALVERALGEDQSLPGP
jgi:hypothetical protein